MKNFCRKELLYKVSRKDKLHDKGMTQLKKTSTTKTEQTKN